MTSKINVLSRRRDDVNDEMMCTNIRFKLVYDKGSMPKLRRLMSHIASLSNMTTKHKTVLYGSASSHCRPKDDPEAKTNTKRVAHQNTESRPKQLSARCLTRSMNVDDPLSDQKMSARQSVGDPLLPGISSFGQDGRQHVPVPNLIHHCWLKKRRRPRGPCCPATVSEKDVCQINRGQPACNLQRCQALIAQSPSSLDGPNNLFESQANHSPRPSQSPPSTSTTTAPCHQEP